MCGFAGFLGTFPGVPDASWPSILTCMGSSIAHRGPDDEGTWLDNDCRVGMVHRRLSILDLSEAGHQPMVSASGRLVMVFNGEIYNHLELRASLAKAGHQFVWRGHSDTETLLAAIEVWGIDRALSACVGMFAVAVWDRNERCLHIARDRMGEKPIYYGWQKGVFLFGSELKALRLHPAFERDIDRDALAVLMRHSYVLAPRTIYRGIKKLAPGTVLRIAMGSSADDHDPPKQYWSVDGVVQSGNMSPFRGGEAEAILELEDRLYRAVGLQMAADVPVGVFLSGGIDSSTIGALMQKQSATPIKTYTIGFREKSYDEADYARDVAKFLGAEHTELYVTPEDAISSIPELVTLYDEPFSDSSQIPTLLLSRLARQQVKVALSGDGGDELFGGYNRYLLLKKLWRFSQALPRVARLALVRTITSLSPQGWSLLYGYLAEVLPEKLKSRHAGDKLYKLTEILECDGPARMYQGLTSNWKNPADVVIGARDPMKTLLKDFESDDHDLERYLMHLDSVGYLPDDILVKLDRAAMGVSLETRLPFLDHRVVEFTWSLPSSMKIRDGRGKWILRQVLNKHIPPALTNRPKMGFSVPIDTWLRGPLREWAEELLAEERLKREGYLDATQVRQKWSEHLSNKRNWQYHLWDVLIFQAWLENESRTSPSIH